MIAGASAGARRRIVWSTSCARGRCSMRSSGRHLAAPPVTTPEQRERQISELVHASKAPEAPAPDYLRYGPWIAVAMLVVVAIRLNEFFGFLAFFKPAIVVGVGGFL